MKKGVIAIYDCETDYAYQLMDYLNRKGDFELEVMVFTNQDSLVEYLQEDTMDVLLIGDDLILDGVDCSRIGTIIKLTEHNTKRDGANYSSIYKYQSAEHVMRELLVHYVKQDSIEPSIWNSLEGGKGKLIGVISPSGGSGKSTFAITLGQVLTKEKRVLLLNLEAVPGQYCKEERQGEETAGFSDLVYYIKQKKSNIDIKIKSMLRKIGELEYILPADHYSDLYEMSREDVISLVEELQNNSNYEFIILDIGYISDSTVEFIKCCDILYMPMVRDAISREKEVSFQKMLCMWEGVDLLKRVRKIQVPYDEVLAKGDYQMDQLSNGILGEYVNELIVEIG